MSAKLIDGKAVAAEVNAETAAKIKELASSGIVPGLAVVLVGDNPASQVYVGMKEKKCNELGIFSRKCVLPQDASMDELMTLIDELNADKRIHGILVQSPPPPQIDERKVIESISPEKDVDCFSYTNVGRILTGDLSGFLPCTPYGVQVLLEKYQVDLASGHTVIAGRSNIVGKPLAAMLMQKGKNANATVTVVHSATRNIEKYVADADVLIAAVGVPEFIKGEWIKPGATVIDVGINRINLPDGKRKLVGDVEFEVAAERAGLITPVPGGVGPMTIAMLMRNTLKSCMKHNHLL